MIYPHPIRLRDPWSQIPIDAGVRYQRRFNAPMGLDAREQVWIVVEGVHGPAAFFCNGSLAGEKPADCGIAEFDITSLLRPNNQLAIDIATGENDATPELGPVRLEIRLGPG